MKLLRSRYASAILLLAGLGLWLALLRPVGLGGPASYVFVNGVSMLPTLESGDLVLLQRRDAYRIGEIVAFRIPDGEPGAGSLVIHRIVGGTAAEGFITQGDNKDRPDDWRPTPDLVEGALWVAVPKAGSVVALLRTPTVFASLAAGLVVFFIVLGGPASKQRPARPVGDG